MQYEEVDQLAQRHGAWRLLRSSNVALILSFLGTHLLEANRGAVSQSELAGLLDEHLYAIHRAEPNRYQRGPIEYLEAWSSSDDGWLRRFYPSRSDEIHYEATATLEKAFRWVEQLRERTFVGTESRLHTLVSLLREIVHGSAEDPQVRIDELSRRRDEIDEDIKRIRQGHADALDAVAVRDRYQLFTSISRELLSDFREVEENFRRLDRTAREKIAAWDGGKGELLSQLIADRSDISSSEQGRSFQAFYDFLLSDERQDELAELLADLQGMPTIEADHRIRMLHHDWAEAAERTQATVRTLSEQLRRFLDDRVWFESRRVLDLARAIEAAALAVRLEPPPDGHIGLCINEPGVPIVMPFERPLYQVRPESAVDSLIPPVEAEETDLGALFAQRHVDVERLAENIRAIVPPRSTATLGDIVEMYPPEDGAAEIIAYLTLDSRDDLAVHTDESGRMAIPYTGLDGIERRMILPLVTIERL